MQRVSLVELYERLAPLRHLEPAHVVDRVAVEVAVPNRRREHLPEQCERLVDRDVAQTTLPSRGREPPPDPPDREPVAGRPAELRLELSAIRRSPALRSSTFSAA
jgi:hypothetical protein